MTAARLILLVALAVGCAPPPAPLEDVTPPEGAKFAGADVCVACHDEQATTFAKTPHAWALDDPSRPEQDRGCEACHGPGAAHAEAGGGKAEGGLRAFVREEPASGRSAACLRCHKDDGHARFLRSEHALADVACTDCHEGHGGHGEAMLATAPPELCFGCHAAVRAAFAMPERHGPNTAPPDCLSCHDPHGTPNVASQREANDRRCMDCHGDVAGPWVFEHAPNLVDGCTSCHDPHGSFDRHLLNRQPVAILCYQCHTVTPSSHVQPSYRDCTRCHVAIHGSNTDPHLLTP
jgi:DmsE family decaheme c-type cytochrome